ncbi:MAG: MFS transporter [Spirochaetes bacterium]|nr:MFS transporter [Spirochaetota bacterium]
MSPSKKNFDTNLKIIFGITLIAVMGVASLSPAFPKMVKELKISSQAVAMLITVFTLPGIVLTPVFGFLADRYGRKKVLVPSLILFGIAGGTCLFIRDFHLLLVFRFFQGVGASALMSLSVTIIGDIYSGKERTEIMGYNAGFLSVGTASYPLIGGALATFGWYFPFILPLIAVPFAFVILFILKNPEHNNHDNMSTQFVNGIKSMKNSQVIGLFTVSIATFIILYGPWMSFLPLYLGNTFKASPFIIGLLFSCTSVVTAITSSRMKILTGLFSEKILLRSSFLFHASALVLIPVLPEIALFLIPAAFFGFAQGMNLPSVQSILAGLAPVENRATFMSVNGMVLRVGQTIAPLLMGGILSIAGMDAVFFSSACICLFMFVFSSFVIK